MAVSAYRRLVMARNRSRLITQVVPAPVGGLNTRDQVFDQKRFADAIQLDHWLVRASGPELRSGYQRWATGLDGTVNTVMSYRPGSSGSGKQFALTSNHKLYDVTARSTTTTLPPLTATLGIGTDAGFASHCQFAGVSTNYLAFTYIGDGYYTYDTAGLLVNRTASVTGFNAANASFIGIWKRRIMFVENNTTRLWYLPVDAIQGAAVSFDVGPQLANGGTVRAFANWTYDGGNGIDDHLVIFGSRGDVLVYSGTNIATDTILKGQWYAGTPPARTRFFVQYGGDVKFVTSLGIQELSILVASGQQPGQYRLSAGKNQQQIATDLTATIANSGWEMHLLGRNEQLVLLTAQTWFYTINSTLGGFTRQPNLPVKTANVGFDDYLYAASGSNVYRMFSGDTDDETLVTGPTVVPGTPIEATFQTFFVNISSSANRKIYSLVRLSFLGAKTPDVSARLITEWEEPSALPGYDTSSVSTGSIATLWGSSTWGGGTWNSTAMVTSEFIFGAEGFGTFAGLQGKVRGQPGTVFVNWSPTCEVGKWL